VLRVTLPALEPSESASDSPSASSTAGPTAAPSTRTESREDSELPESTEAQRPEWPWFLTGLLGIAFIVVLTRSLRRR
jgi:hypothetical protein